MLTTLVPLTLAQDGSGAILAISSFSPSGWLQIVQGPVQKVVSFRAVPTWPAGVNSHTLAPCTKLFLSLWYCRRCRQTASARFLRAYSWAASMRFLSFLK